MAQAQWTSVEKAKAYIAVCEKSKVKGLKYCSAVWCSGTFVAARELSP